MKQIIRLFAIIILSTLSLFAQDYHWIEKDGYKELSEPAGVFTGLNYSQDGTKIFTINNDNILQTWDVETGELLSVRNFIDTLATYMSTVVFRSFAFSKFSDKVAIAYVERVNYVVIVYDFGNDSLVSIYNVKIPVGQNEFFVKILDLNLIFLKDNLIQNTALKNVYLGGFGHRECVTVNYDLTKRKIREDSLFHFLPILDCTEHPKKDLFATAERFYSYIEQKFGGTHSYDKKVSIYDIDKREELVQHYLEQHGIPTDGRDSSGYYNNLAFFRNSDRLLATSTENELAVWNYADNTTEKYNTSMPDFVGLKGDIAMVDDDRYCVMAVNIRIDNYQRTVSTYVKFFDVENEEFVDSYFIGNGELDWVLDVATDGKTFATVSNDGYIRIFPAVKGDFPLKARISSNVSGAHELDTVQYYDASYGNPIAWKWDFGDGSTSLLQNPEHIYKNAGTYTVTLIVRDENKYDTTIYENYIEILPELKADFEASKTVGYLPFTVYFENKSKGIYDYQYWSFGDGATSTDLNPGYIYPYDGTYDVSLTLWDKLGSRSIVKKQLIETSFPLIDCADIVYERHYFDTTVFTTFQGFNSRENSLGETFLYSKYETEYDDGDNEHHERHSKLFKYDIYGKFEWAINVYPGVIFNSEDDDGIIFINIEEYRGGDYYINKITRSGEVAKYNSIGTTAVEYGLKDALKTKDGYMIIGTSVINTKDSLTFVAKCDSEFNMQWWKKFHGIGGVACETDHNSYFLAANNLNNLGFTFIEFDQNGETLLYKPYITEKGILSKKMIRTNKSYIICGALQHEDSTGNLYNSAYLMAIDFMGNKLWEMDYDTSGTIFNDIVLINDTTIAVSGLLGKEVRLMIYSTNGYLLEDCVFPYRWGYINSMVKTNDSCLLMTGSTMYRWEKVMNYLVKIRLKDYETDVQMDETFSQPPFPNPTQDNISIAFDGADSGAVTLEITDIFGNKLDMLHSPAGSQSVTYNTSGLASGVYFYSGTAGTKKISGKFIVAR